MTRRRVDIIGEAEVDSEGGHTTYLLNETSQSTYHKSWATDAPPAGKEVLYG